MVVTGRTVRWVVIGRTGMLRGENVGKRTAVTAAAEEFSQSIHAYHVLLSTAFESAPT